MKVSHLALQLSLEGSRPELYRINLKYVCPSQVGKVDAAVKELQSSVNAVDKACEVPKNMRTQDQQDMVDAVGC